MIRKLKIDDLDEILLLEKSLFSLPWSKDDYLKDINDNEFSEYYVYEEKGEIIGYFGLWIIYDQAQITTIATSKIYQSNGIGSKMMIKIIELATSKGCEVCTLEVRKSNISAIKLYEKYGFSVVTVRKGYYSDNYEDALLMMKGIGGCSE
ncbi:MAG: ribosomal protein S18-alanine N-acetyltransferase [Anaerorhabdus sp.]